MKPKGKRQGRPALSVRMDAKQLKRLYRMAKKLDHPDASALIRGLVAVILDGSPEVRSKTLADLARRLDEFDGERGGQFVMRTETGLDGSQALHMGERAVHA